MKEHEGAHEPLPWYVNGTLTPSESLEFEKHISICASCHDELKRLKTLQSHIVEGGEAMFSPHPDAESVVAIALGDELPEGESRAIRRHLAICPQCSLETSWIKGRPASTGVALARPFARQAARRWRAVAAAAVVVALAGAAVAFRSFLSDRTTTMTLDAYILDATVRADGVETIEPPAGADGFSLVVRVDAAPQDLPLDLRIIHGRGAVVFHGEHDRPLLQGMFLVLYCDLPQFPDGDYTLQVRSSTDPSRLTEHRFRLRRHAD